MSAVIYSFSLEPGLDRVPGAAPLAVLSRQIPRQVVLGLNAGEDRGLRFFPFMGQIDGLRKFFELPELLPIQDLLGLHGQDPAPAWLVDGWIHSAGLRVRIIDGRSGAIRFEEDLDFNPAEPWPAVQRIQFELLGCLGWSGGPSNSPDLAGHAAGWFLIARDDLLALEANHLRPDPARSLRAVGEAFALSPGSPDVRDLLLEICQQMLRQKVAQDAIVSFLLELCAALEEQTSPFIVAVGAIIEAAGGMVASLPIYQRLAAADPTSESALKAGVVLFQQGQHALAREILRKARESGNRSTALRAQLAVVEVECGNRRASEAILEELVVEDRLSAAVTRLVCSHLLLKDRYVEAIALIDRALSQEPTNPSLYFDRGRALLARRRGAEAAVAFRDCLANRPGSEIRREARRYLALVDDPQTLGKIEALERALEAGELRKAVRLGKALCRVRPELAEAWLLYGVARQRCGHIRRALSAFRRALSLQAELGEAHNRLGILLAQRGRPAEGYIHLRQASELCPEDSSPLLHLAQVCYRLDKGEEGAAALARAERLGGHEREAEAVRRALGGGG